MFCSNTLKEASIVLHTPLIYAIPFQALGIFVHTICGNGRGRGNKSSMEMTGYLFIGGVIRGHGGGAIPSSKWGETSNGAPSLGDPILIFGS